MARWAHAHEGRKEMATGGNPTRQADGIPLMHKYAVKTTGPTATGTLTAAQNTARFLTCDLGAAATLTTLTATLLAAELSSAIQVGDGYYITIINTSAEDGRIVTVAGGTNVTIVGRTTIDSQDTPASNPESEGTFFVQYTATTPAFDMIRVG